jgi:hypothetical protein
MVFVACMAVISSTAFAQTKTETGLSYTRIGVGYVSATVNDDYVGSVTLTGVGLGSSSLIGQNLIVTASVQSVSNGDGDYYVPRVRVIQSAIGVGGRMMIAPHADLYGTISYLNATSETDYNAADTGTDITVGIKASIAPSLVSSVFASHSKMTKSDSFNSFGMELEFNVTPSIVVGGSYISGKNANQYGLTLSYAF